MGQNRILIIEDEKDLVMMLKMRLEAAGFKVSSAGDGKSGLAAAKETLPDLIILDIIMPLVDGYHVCQNLKSDDTTRNIPIVILTASGVHNIVSRCLDAGASYCMRKPFNSEVLISKIKELLEVR